MRGASRELVSLLRSNGPLSEELLAGLAESFSWRRSSPDGWADEWDPIAELRRREIARWFWLPGDRYELRLLLVEGQPLLGELEERYMSESADTEIIVKSVEPRSLVVKISDAEKLERGQKAAYMKDLLDKHKAQVKSDASRAKERTNELQTEVDTLLRSVRRGEEYREVACEERLDHRRAVREIVRLDTGAIVDSEPLEPNELLELRQAKLQLGTSAEVETADGGKVERDVVEPASGERREGATAEGDEVSAAEDDRAEAVSEAVRAGVSDMDTLRAVAAGAEPPKTIGRKRKMGGAERKRRRAAKGGE